MAIYRPRVAAILQVPVAGGPDDRNIDSGEAVTLPVKVASARLTFNDSNRADELSLTLDWHNVGLDVRLVRNAIVELHIGESDDAGDWTPGRHTLQFLGVATHVERRSGEDEPYELELRALDYTDFFLRAKPFGSSGVPTYDQTLDAAWRRIVSQTPGAEVLADRILWLGPDPSIARKQELRAVLNGKQSSLSNAPFPVLGKAVNERFASLGKVATAPRTDAWAVWQQCVGSLGLLSWIDRDHVVVATSEGYYQETNPPVFSWGKNIAKLSESTEPFFRKGIILSAFDPLTGKSVEARYQPPNEILHQTKAERSGKRPTVDKEADWEIFEIEGTTDPQALAQKARRVYEERSRQEMQGTLSTSELRVDDVNGNSVDVLQLRHGDDVQIEFDSSTRDLLMTQPDTDSRIRLMRGLGYDENTATILAKNFEMLRRYSPIFYVRQVDHSIEMSDDAGRFDTEITYCSRILTASGVE